jgi:hypothetical protein
MKTIPIIFLSLCVICSAETADEIARKTVPGFVGFDNGLDHSPEGRRKTALNNAEFNLEHYMASDKVPEGVRIIPSMPGAPLLRLTLCKKLSAGFFREIN